MTQEIMKRELDIQTLISEGLANKAGIDVMERLYALAKDMKAIQAREMFFQALARLQSEMKTIEKTRKVLGKDNKVRYSYAPLESIIEQVKANLKDNGFSYTLKTNQVDKAVSVTCEAHHETGHTEVSTVTVQIDDDSYMSDPQKVGAAITYAKRYAFCNAFGIMTGDEDTDAVDPEPAEVKRPKDAPPFPEEPKAPTKHATLSAELLTLFNKQTDTLDAEMKKNCWEDTLKKYIPAKKKYFGITRDIELMNVDQLEVLIDGIKEGENA